MTPSNPSYKSHKSSFMTDFNGEMEPSLSKDSGGLSHRRKLIAATGRRLSQKLKSFQSITSDMEDSMSAFLNKTTTADDLIETDNTSYQYDYDYEFSEILEKDKSKNKSDTVEEEDFFSEHEHDNEDRISLPYNESDDDVDDAFSESSLDIANMASQPQAQTIDTGKMPKSDHKVNASPDKIREGRSQKDKLSLIISKGCKPNEPLSVLSSRLLNYVNIRVYNDQIYRFNSKCYVQSGKNEIIRLYREVVDHDLGNETTLSRIRQLTDYLISDPLLLITDADIDNTQRIAVLNNCIYNVESGKKSRHSSEVVAFSYVNANFVDKPHCPCFDNFLKEVFGNDPVLTARFWMILGYLFMQTNEAKAFFHMGEAPDSGKSLVGNFVQSCFIKDFVSNLTLQDFNQKFRLVRLVGKAINISLDLPSTKLSRQAVSKIKMITGGDNLGVEEKGEPVFEFKNTAKLLFASNHPIILFEDDAAFFNRLVYIPFDISVPPDKQDKTLPDKFCTEKDSIVSKALMSAKELIEDNFVFPSTREIDMRIRSWREQDIPSIDYFLDECCLIDSGAKGELMKKLYAVYESYCQSKGLAPKSSNSLKQYLENNVGLKHCKMRDGGENPQSAFKGIKLIADDSAI